MNAPTRAAAPTTGVGATAQTQTEVTTRLADLEARLEATEAVVAALYARQTCRRCTMEPPPAPRWGGDLWARDLRPPHTCGLPPGAA